LGGGGGGSRLSEVSKRERKRRKKTKECPGRGRGKLTMFDKERREWDLMRKNRYLSCDIGRDLFTTKATNKNRRERLAK
jgi:hypothetical protein